MYLKIYTDTEKKDDLLISETHNVGGAHEVGGTHEVFGAHEAGVHGVGVAHQVCSLQAHTGIGGGHRTGAVHRVVAGGHSVAADCGLAS